jgi:hypothetical protein
MVVVVVIMRDFSNAAFLRVSYDSSVDIRREVLDV